MSLENKLTPIEKLAVAAFVAVPLIGIVSIIFCAHPH